MYTQTSKNSKTAISTSICKKMCTQSKKNLETAIKISTNLYKLIFFSLFFWFLIFLFLYIIPGGNYDGIIWALASFPRVNVGAMIES